MRLILLFAIVIVFISSLPGGQAEDVAEATKSLPKEAGLLGLDGPLDQLDLTKMLAESFEAEEQEGSEETSPSGHAVEEKPSRLRSRSRKRGTPNTFFHRRNRKRNPMPKLNRPSRNGFSIGLIASPENYGWRRRSATNWNVRSSR